jgi:hypothetical protein
VLPESLIYTDEYSIYGRLNDWGYAIRVWIMGKRSMQGMRMEMASLKSI